MSVTQRINSEVVKKADEKTSQMISDVFRDSIARSECGCRFAQYLKYSTIEDYYYSIRIYTRCKKYYKKWNPDAANRKIAVFKNRIFLTFSQERKIQWTEKYHKFLREYNTEFPYIKSQLDDYESWRIWFKQSRPCPKCYPISLLIMKGFVDEDDQREEKQEQYY